MKLIVTILLLILIFANQSNTATAQGCVAIRSTGNVCMMSHPDTVNNTTSKWVLATNFRYFKSFRHFSGTEENKARIDQHTNVINHTGSMDINLTRILNDRWSLMVDLPVISNSRSSLYEHGLINGTNTFNQRHTMHSFGIGDVRLAAYYWLLDPIRHRKANIQVGLGIKLPTGDYNYEDYWYNVGYNGSKELRPVDQSIQLGDGGTGFTFETNLYYNFMRNVAVYGNFYYLSNPREQNGTRTYRETLRADLANENIMSVPDQYMLRGGVSYAFAGTALRGLSVSGGVRLEGVPVYDLIGGSGDFRRPGYVWSVEPSIVYSAKKFSAFASVPVAFVRNRTQSVTDKEYTKSTGTFKQGDAAFADYAISAGVAFKF